MKGMNHNDPDLFAGLYSGDILRAVVQALDIEDAVLRSRTARRFFAGESVDEYNRYLIFESLGRVLIDYGMVPETVDALPDGVSLAMAVGMGVGLVGERWDHLMATIHSRGTAAVDVSAVGQRFLRLVAVDLSLRVFALHRLTGFPLPDAEPPLWVQENGGGRILRHHLARAGLTRDQLARRIGASYSSVDNWLDGKTRPNRRYIGALAGELATLETGLVAEKLERELRRQFTLARLANLLAALIGREPVVEMTTTVARFARMLSDSLDFPLSNAEHPKHVELRLLIFGCLEDSAPVLLWWLGKLETDPEWKRDILAASEPWEFHFEHAAAVHSKRSAAGLSQDMSDLVDNDAGLDPEISAAIRQELLVEAKARESIPLNAGGPRLVLDLLQDSIDRRRRLVHRFPHSPEAHYQLGSFLGMAGKNLGARELVDEGIVECKIAAGLLPNWDGPAVECGIMLANINEYGAALRELEQARLTLAEATPHLRFVTGYVLTMLEQYTDALEHLDAVIEARPDFASAHRYAARCAFELGDKTKGRRHAKAARQLGEFTEYMAWRDGAYSSRNGTRGGMMEGS